ncbi:DUF411 domain-containing protein [Erythrobacter aureus]|nr:DUF411 domain-containing protein [Erythrobacter aureus]
MKTLKSLAVATTLSLAALSQAAQAATYTMYRDPNCGCCHKWAEQMEAKLKVDIAVVNRADMVQVKKARGVPADLASCHTMTVAGYVIEGHVPAKEIQRLLKEKPRGVTGLAVPGMPLGSPGMEAPGHEQHYQPYKVVAFGKSGTRTYASYR